MEEKVNNDNEKYVEKFRKFVNNIILKTFSDNYSGLNLKHIAGKEYIKWISNRSQMWMMNRKYLEK